MNISNICFCANGQFKRYLDPLWIFHERKNIIDVKKFDIYLFDIYLTLTLNNLFDICSLFLQKVRE